MLGRPGYRETSCGVLPDDWSVMPLSALLHDFRGGAPLRPDDFTRSGMKVLPKGGVGWRGYLDVAEESFQYCSDAYAANHLRNIVDQTFTIVVLRDLVPSGPTIGLMVQIRGAATYLLAQGVYGFRVDERVAIPSYLVQLSQTRWYRRLVNGIMVGSTQVHITNTAFKEAQIPVPPLPEQKAIAVVLSDVDALLGALDRLIAKKRDLKQAAMQQLLTGQTRLPGFSGKWETKRLGEVVGEPLLNGVFNAPGKKGRGCRLINVGDLYAPAPIDTSALELYDASKDDLRRFAVRNGDIFFTRSSLTPDGIAHCNVYQSTGKEPVVFDCHIIRARANPGLVNPLFLFRYCVSAAARRYLVANAKTTTMTTIDQGVLKNLPIAIPPLPEQNAIAELLLNMDAELTALEQRRDKTRLLKQGMMQELLTGRTRLV